MAGICLALVFGCTDEAAKKPKPVMRYPTLPKKMVPSFMHGTVWERVDVGNTDPYPVSGYGLVVNLDNTGDSTAPTAVRQYMRKEMTKRGFGSKAMPGYEYMPPDRVLRDKRVAIVTVTGLLPPGIRKGQSFDVYVACLPKNTTTSLAGGELYLTDLKKDGANPQDPFGAVNVFAEAKGFIFVNPAYALSRDPNPRGAARQSLRNGVVLDGGIASFDRPLFLQLREPENRVSRYIEQRLIDRFQDTGVASAKDEGVIQIFVPRPLNGDWQHFAKLVTHVYLDGTPEVLTARAKQLVVEAQKPNALLDDISYCWEGIGPAALPFISPLLTDHRPEVAYAAARAGAYIGDPTGAANAALAQMARTDGYPFQLNAVQTLGNLPPSAAVNHMLRELLDSDKALVRIEAYKVLARNHDPSVFSRTITEDPNNQKFILDVVPSHAQPIVYASRSGTPRIAIIGQMPEVALPVMFSAMQNRLTISSSDVGRLLTIFYRSEAARDVDGQYRDFKMAAPVRMASSPELAEVIARLGGIAADTEQPLNFTYGEVLAILQRLNDEHKLVTYHEGQQLAASFVLQEPPNVRNTIYAASPIDSDRPQTDDRLQGDRGSSRAVDPADAALAVEKK